LAPNSTTVSGQVIQQSLIITAALPQVLVAGALYLLLGLAALIISFRTPGAPFTVAGVLMMHSKLAALHLSDKDDEKDDDMVEGLTK
jgi:membrane protein implicated in regulation of membrane protease activity